MAYIRGGGGGKEYPYIKKLVGAGSGAGTYTDSYHKAGDIIVAFGWGYSINSGAILKETWSASSDAGYGYVFETTDDNVSISFTVNFQAVRLSRNSKALNYEILQMASNRTGTFNVKEGDVLGYPQYNTALGASNSSDIKPHTNQTVDLKRIDSDGQTTTSTGSSVGLKIVRIY